MIRPLHHLTDVNETQPRSRVAAYQCNKRLFRQKIRPPAVRWVTATERRDCRVEECRLPCLLSGRSRESNTSGRYQVRCLQRAAFFFRRRRLSLSRGSWMRWHPLRGRLRSMKCWTAISTRYNSSCRLRRTRPLPIPCFSETTRSFADGLLSLLIANGVNLVPTRKPLVRARQSEGDKPTSLENEGRQSF